MGKITEKLIHDQLMTHLENHNKLNLRQFGFRKGKSTTAAAAQLLDAIQLPLDNKEFVLVLFLDFKKAFDTVNHSILIEKIKKY